MALQIADLYAAINPGSAFDQSVQPVDVVSDPNVNAQAEAVAGKSLFSTIGDGITGLAGLFDNGINIYKSITGQFEASKQIAAEKQGPANVVVVPTSQSGSLLTQDNLLKIGLVVGLGILLFVLLKRR